MYLIPTFFSFIFYHKFDEIYIKIFFLKAYWYYVKKCFFQMFFEKLAFDGLDTYRVGTGTGNLTCQKSEPEPYRNFSKVGTGNVKNSYGSTTLQSTLDHCVVDPCLLGDELPMAPVGPLRECRPSSCPPHLHLRLYFCPPSLCGRDQFRSLCFLYLRLKLPTVFKLSPSLGTISYSTPL
jgi:hypothetical protein